MGVNRDTRDRGGGAKRGRGRGGQEQEGQERQEEKEERQKKQEEEEKEEREREEERRRRAHPRKKAAGPENERCRQKGREDVFLLVHLLGAPFALAFAARPEIVRCRRKETIPPC